MDHLIYSAKNMKHSLICFAMLLTLQQLSYAQLSLSENDIFIIKHDFQNYILHDILKDEWELSPEQDPRILLCRRNEYFNYFMPIKILESDCHGKSCIIKLSIEGWYLTNSSDTILLPKERPLKYSDTSYFLSYNPTASGIHKLLFMGSRRETGLGIGISMDCSNVYFSSGISDQINSRLTNCNILKKPSSSSNVLDYDSYFGLFHKNRISHQFKDWLIGTQQLDTATAIFVINNSIFSPKPILMLVPPVQAGVRPRNISEQTLYLVWFEEFTTIFPEMPTPRKRYPSGGPPPPTTELMEKSLIHQVVFPICLRPRNKEDIVPQWRLLSEQEKNELIMNETSTYTWYNLRRFMK